MAIELDNLHYDYREIDGYNKPFNFVVSPREPGKTSMMWLKKIYFGWKKDHRPWIYLVRQSVEISSALIDSIADTILNKFTDDNVQFVYKMSSFKDGITDVYIKEGETKSLFFRVVSLNIQLRRIKLAVLKQIKGVFMDEYIIDPRKNEKYIPQEANIIKEAYTTWRREADGVLKFYFVGNPYSLFNPLFVDWGVDTNQCKLDSFYVGSTYVIHFATLKPELREKLLRDNPLYKFDEEYTQYALYGTPVNDLNIRIGDMPKNFSLRFIFRHDGKTIGVYRNNNYSEDYKFFARFTNEYGKNRDVYCFEFKDLLDHSVIMSLEERLRLVKFKEAFRKRFIVFEDINCYYFLEEIYKNI